MADDRRTRGGEWSMAPCAHVLIRSMRHAVCQRSPMEERNMQAKEMLRS